MLSPNPIIIQGGMGVGVSCWRLARAVAETGQLGVVSGTALDGVVARVLQDGDPGGHVRRALSHFPVPELAQRVVDRYFIEGGRRADAPYRPHPTLGIDPKRSAIELCLAGSFAEVWLAKEGHNGLIGINFLEKIQTASLSGVLGAMLAGVDYMLVGAGIPKEFPRLLDSFAAGQVGQLAIEVINQTRTHIASLDPVKYLGADLPELHRPKMLAIISLHILATYLTKDPAIRPDGFVVEGPLAGGHSAPPRGRMTLDESGQPIYSVKDEADLAKVAAAGLPFWLAGAWGSPEKVAEARALGAVGVQAGSVFALSTQSGLRPDLRDQLLAELDADQLVVRNDPLASPTGFPFKIATLPGTLSEEELYQERDRICDLGYLRQPVEKADGSVVYRCASEPVHMFLKKGGEISETVGRKCLCNALFADIGLAQHRKDGSVEKPALTLGQDLAGVKVLRELYPEGYSAAQVVAWLLGQSADISG